MKKLSITIMAHPARAEFIPYLQERLGGDVPVIYDEKSNIWDTCRRAWLAHDMDAEYGLVIQDDAIVCDNFRERAERVLESQDGVDFITSFFAGQLCATRINRARKAKQDYFLSGMIFNEVALCMPTKMIADMVKYCDDRESNTDQDITKWARLRRLRIWYSVPSLIDHRDAPSIYREVYKKPDFSKPRHAYYYAEKE